MMKKNVIILMTLSLFSISNAQFSDADLNAIERIQNQEYNKQQQAKKAAAARQAKINADRAAKQAKIEAREENKYIKLESRDDELYELEMEIKRMELMARKKQLDRDARKYDIELMREEAKADREVALERSRSKKIDEYTDAEILNEKNRAEISKSSEDKSDSKENKNSVKKFIFGE